MTDLVLHALSVGGGLLALSQMPGRHGNYVSDLAFVREWRPSVVLTLTTRGELADHDADRFGADMKESGTRWVHLPVRDFGVPDEAFIEQWPATQEMALQALSGSGRVLVHCLGGCGRSGMVALRLMAEAGEEAEVALTRLRKVRPCAIETEAQMQWAMTGRMSGHIVFSTTQGKPEA